ncbi:hypothetical protein [uncultured Desulfobacter sp.]|uniref:hypothetical protein n=1 Tax=uncultured Desulfobacter sp. TaxID=240139 RepID=UPI002AAA95FF|nr:hypothetical protein [uncultured Desulfobacter sp.]
MFSAPRDAEAVPLTRRSKKGINGREPVRQEMMCDQVPADASGWAIYNAPVAADRPPEDYTARLIPALRRRCDPPGKQPDSMAAMMKTMENNIITSMPHFCFSIEATSILTQGVSSRALFLKT